MLNSNHGTLHPPVFNLRQTLMKLYLKRNEDRRIRAGHLWVYSNEIDNPRSPLKQFEAGSVAQLYSNNQTKLGTVYVNPNSLICARLVSRESLTTLDQDFFNARLKQALTLRERLYSEPYYRLVFSEGDYLPGVIIDRFDSTVVVQINTAGMDRAKQALLDSLDQLLTPDCILLKNDTAARETEGLSSYVEVVKGSPAQHLQVVENGCRFNCSLLEGQKTGWFYDHRDNRNRLLKYVDAKRLLDVYSYTGAWSIPAARHGAASVTAVDSSKQALEYLQQNAALNDVPCALDTLQGDALVSLRRLQEDGERFDVIVLDPPAFIKRKKDLKQGTEAYAQINRLGMRLLNPGGILVSASCSFHFSADMLKNVLLKASVKTGRQLQILEHGFQGPDHPWHPAIPETNYLKSFICRIN